MQRRGPLQGYPSGCSGWAGTPKEMVVGRGRCPDRLGYGLRRAATGGAGRSGCCECAVRKPGLAERETQYCGSFTSGWAGTPKVMIVGRCSRPGRLGSGLRRAATGGAGRLGCSGWAGTPKALIAGRAVLPNWGLFTGRLGP